jgi:UDP-N-acetylmuramoyl-tripeptide--D-alanyl-D-alanine ligase
MMDTGTAARAVTGRLIGASVRFSRVVTDSRTLRPGDLFVALRGERFDGHAFVPAALAQGAVAAIVAESHADGLAGDLIAVEDPLAALGRLAAHWRAQFSLPLIVVVGSNGKTTVKEMTAAILRAAFGPDHVLATEGNLNNAIGLPLTLLRMRREHRAAVIELGMNHRGETAELAALARPTIALVNNAQREHQEFMASVAEVAAEHADAIGALAAGGLAVLNADDPHVHGWRTAAQRVRARDITFGLDAPAEVAGRCTLHATGTELDLVTPAGPLRAHLEVPGRHMARNALAAVAAALGAGVGLDAVAEGLARFRAVPGRLVATRAAAGAVVLDDSYNANPDSMRAAIDVLAAAPGERWLAMGDMGEVGADGPEFHREIGAYARACGVTALYAAGELARDAVTAFGPGARHFDSVDLLAARIAGDLHAGVCLLVKGSRFMRMERVVAAAAGNATGAHGC